MERFPPTSVQIPSTSCYFDQPTWHIWQKYLQTSDLVSSINKEDGVLELIFLYIYLNDNRIMECFLQIYHQLRVIYIIQPGIYGIWEDRI